MKSSKISANDWRKSHPVSIGVLASDLYYTRLCNNFLNTIEILFQKTDVEKTGNKDFALLLGHYVEDVVSNTHVFDSFRKNHNKMYGKKLPFYEISSDYADDEVNLEDIKFLVWNHVQQLKIHDAIINPDNEAINYIAQELFPLICDAYEEAPEVTELYDFIYDFNNYTDFIESKKVLSWLLTSNPLTSPVDFWDTIHDELIHYAENEKFIMDPNKTTYTIISLRLFKTPCNWLALLPNEILATMLETEGMKEESKKMANLRHTGIRTFELKNQYNYQMSIFDLETGDSYKVNTDSFECKIEAKHNYILTDLVSFDNQTWEINGISQFFNGNLKKTNTVTDGEIAFNHHLKTLNGKRIGYFKNMEEMRSKMIGDKPINIPNDISSYFHDNEPIVVFLNSDGTLYISPTLAASLPDPSNPYFKEIDDATLLGSALNECVASVDMAKYIHEQGWYDEISLSSSISPKRGHDLFHNNFDFLLRYFRGAEYISM